MGTETTSSDLVSTPPVVPVHPAGASTATVPEPSGTAAKNDHASSAEIGHEDSLESSVVWLLVLSFAQKSIGFIRSIVICRWLDPVNMGAWGMALALMETLLPLSLLSVPGCFGRYVEHFRQRGQLKGFLRQSVLICMATLSVTLVITYCLQDRLADFCFGSPSYRGIFLFAVVAMVPSAVFAFCGELLVALRLGRASTTGTFCRGVAFTLITIGLLLFWRADVVSMITAFGVSYLLALAMVLRPVLQTLATLEDDEEALPVARTWTGLSRFLVAFWLTNFLTNMFFTIDRYMLVNLGEDATSSLRRVGNYESANTIPILVATIVLMVSRLILPYLVREWESDNRDYVWNYTNLCIKVTAMALFAGGWCLACCAEPIFDIWFRGQYDEGLAVVPISIGIYSFAGLSTMWMNYFLCIERAWLCTATTGVAVVFNIAANLLLIPRFGLMGAAWASLLANCALIGCSIVVAHIFEFRMRAETALLAFLPLALCVPPAVAAAIAIAIIALLLAGRLISQEERAVLHAIGENLVQKLRQIAG